MPTASNSTVIARAPDDVFAFIADGTTAPRWRGGVTDVALVSGSGVGAKYSQGVKGPGGRRVAADYEVTAYDPPRRLAFAATAGPVRPTGAYVLEAVPEGTRVTFSLDARLGGIKGLLIGGSVQKSMDAEVGSLARLKAILEGGG
jgi:uncharacterized protein YndB with AHSA1/START domain